MAVFQMSSLQLIGCCWRGHSVARICLFACLLAQILTPVVAYGKGKSKFLAVYPMIFKFCMFWWCAVVFVIMAVFIIDHLFTKFKGPQRVDFVYEHTFRSVAEREAYWAQLADPSTWSPAHPVLQSADVRMVEFGTRDVNPGAAGARSSDTNDAAVATTAEVSTDLSMETDNVSDGSSFPTNTSMTLKPVPLGPLKEGFGMVLRHKKGTRREGGHFATRKCTKLETPQGNEPWRIVMRTVEVGGGYPFVPDTEECTVDMWPLANDGTMKSVVIGRAACSSRLFCWWHSLQQNSELAAQAMLDGIGEEIGHSKKKD
eukprot:TRINITY_DN49749_c0_g1_i1.p1 TRINITY_DN49749_c0_g1~~TRINITY_DN49749_c0_g1_i1.p1  ORF type:complete len:315 (-),score=45.64 TRINITY_DN49749_c0_g1_i1:131-1075(-)